MSMRYLGFVLLMWIPVLRAQTTQSCEPPTLDSGYFVPDEDVYLHGALLTYACEKGFKPSVEGWWASSTCENGKWVHEPQCIDEQDCILPTIPNGQNTENVTVFKNGDTLQIKCNKGYDHKDDVAAARCENGKWSSLPICEKNATACDHPPKVPHAVILQQGYMEVFPAGTEVLYICEDGYAIEGTHASIFCKAGDWEKEPTCSQPPPINTGTNEREIAVSVSKCGTHPTIEHGDIVEVDAKFLRIRCDVFYRRVGPGKVVCYTDGTWSQLPICQDTRCLVDTTEYPDLLADGVKHIRDGQKLQLRCVKKHWYWVTDHYSSAECIQGRVIVSECRGFAGRKLEEIKEELELAFSD